LVEAGADDRPLSDPARLVSNAMVRVPAGFAFLLTDPANGGRRSDYESLGTQVDLRFHVLHWYDMTLSVGYAVGFKEGRRSGDEWMLSLKIM